jgi:hypothetical protein
MDRSRLIFVEGIMGSGKSTTARWLARLFRRAGIPAQPVPEARPHPTNVFRSLPHWKQPWLDLTSEELVRRNYVKWQAFVAKALSSSHIFVFDGQLFHGDFTCLFLMNCPPRVLEQYVHTVLQLAGLLNPMILYCYQDDVAQALDHIGAQRGQGWVESQVAWKVASPYGQQRGLVGIEAGNSYIRIIDKSRICVSRGSRSLRLRSRPVQASGSAIRRASVRFSIFHLFRSLSGSDGFIRSMIILSIFVSSA